MAASETWTVGRMLEWTVGHFKQKGVAEPLLDAQVLLAHALGCQRIQLYTTFDAEVAEPERATFRELLKRRADGCPVAYLVERREFYGLEFAVTRDVLIPRPETEYAVIAALDFAKTTPDLTFIDVGTGSGAIAVTLAKKLPIARGVAIDVSAAALAVARQNAERHGVADRLRFLAGDLLEPLGDDPPVDLVVSNPPYVATTEWDALAAEVREHEPRLALDGGTDGLAIIARLIDAAPARLKPGGRLVLEVGCRQEPTVHRRLLDAGVWSLKPTIKDGGGHPRIVIAERNR